MQTIFLHLTLKHLRNMSRTANFLENIYPQTCVLTHPSSTSPKVMTTLLSRNCSLTSTNIVLLWLKSAMRISYLPIVPVYDKLYCSWDAYDWGPLLLKFIFQPGLLPFYFSALSLRTNAENCHCFFFKKKPNPGYTIF